MAEEEHFVTIRIDGELLKKIDDAADVLQLTRSGLIRLLLVSFVDGDVRGFFSQMGKVVTASKKTRKKRIAEKAMA